MKRKKRTLVVGLICVALVVAGTPIGTGYVIASSDPLRRAKHATEDLARWEANVLATFRRIRDQLEEAGTLPDPVWDRSVTLDEFKELIAQLRVPARWLLENRDEFDEALSGYESALPKAATAMRGASDKYASFAQEYPDNHTLRQHYLVLSQHAEEAASALEHRSGTFQAERDELEVKLAFVEESLLYLDRLGFFIELYPANSEASRIQFYLEQLNGYIERFEETVALFDSVSGQLADSSSS
jgi:hypothetical protein